MIISRPIHVAANGIISFFFMAEEYSMVHMSHRHTSSLTIHLSMDTGVDSTVSLLESMSPSTALS